MKAGSRVRRLSTGLSLLISGCAGALSWNPQSLPPGTSSVVAQQPLRGTYTVRQGDTLYSIAWRYGLDYHDLAAWNNIGPDFLIKPGQQLVLAAPSSFVAAAIRPTAPTAATSAGNSPPSGPVHWIWPTRGALVGMFHPDNALSKGIDIAGMRGQGIQAAAAGKVVYTGSAIAGYGKLIIIKNSDRFLSAYADNDSMLVREGDVVKAGEPIATMGLDRNGHPLLHFEIRYNGKPVNPLSYLPAH
ncbi:MAG: peptidoglycan DD-metalloendopeptidase family protein [Gammaproteobacteria bacterium]|nr:peptidoglycan DD-metalloendopeptidase family protein [Gammaproteobacteria bacterium]